MEDDIKRLLEEVEKRVLLQCKDKKVSRLELRQMLRMELERRQMSQKEEEWKEMTHDYFPLEEAVERNKEARERLLEEDKYLFLDIDGVLNTMEYARACQWKYGRVSDEDGAFFDPEAVKNLKYILECVPAKLIISSSWRKNGLEWMNHLWRKRNLPGEIYSLTPILGSSSSISYAKRGLEINEWLRTHTNREDSPYRYAIIDDEDDFLFTQFEHLIVVDPELGLTKDMADKVIELLISKTE